MNPKLIESQLERFYDADGRDAEQRTPKSGGSPGRIAA
jgi:hypothetical protein